MKHKGYMLLLVCPLLTGARDPFLPVEDRCQITPLTQWRYGGGTGHPALWLTRLDYQPQGITLNGLALNLKAVAALEKALSKLEDFQPVTPGATQRDAQGRWSFSFFLAGETTDAGSD